MEQAASSGNAVVSATFSSLIFYFSKIILSLSEKQFITYLETFSGT